MRHVLCISILLSAASIPSMESGLFVDTRSRLGYEWTVQSWFRTGLAASLFYQGENVNGGIGSRKNYGLIAPFIDLRAGALGLEMGLNSYLSFQDGGPTTSSTSRNVYRLEGNWLGLDAYIGKTFGFERFEIVPMLHILRYGYSMTGKLHAIGYGFLPEGRFALRF